MTVIQISEKRNAHADVLVELWRLIKFHNPTSLLNITGEDIQALAKTLQDSYLLDVVQRAKDAVVSRYSGKNLTIGVFLENCQVLQRDSEMNINEVENGANARIRSTNAAIKRLAMRGIYDPRIEGAKFGMTELYLLAREYDRKLENEVKIIK